MKRERDNRRLEKATDELIKIQDDGHGNADIVRILDLLWSLRNKNSN